MGDEDETVDEAEPSQGMSWYVVAFMAICLFMSAATAWYAWGVFEAAV